MNDDTKENLRINNPEEVKANVRCQNSLEVRVIDQQTKSQLNRSLAPVVRRIVPRRIVDDSKDIESKICDPKGLEVIINDKNDKNMTLESKKMKLISKFEKF